MESQRPKSVRETQVLFTKNPGNCGKEPGDKWQNKTVVRFKELPQYHNSQLIFWEDVNDCECISFGGRLEMVGGPQHVFFFYLLIVLGSSLILDTSFEAANQPDLFAQSC